MSRRRSINYAREAGEDVALRFVAALRNGCRLIATRPATGSPRFAHDLDLPGLRHRRLRRFPYLVFYMEQPDRIDGLAHADALGRNAVDDALLAKAQGLPGVEQVKAPWF